MTIVLDLPGSTPAEVAINHESLRQLAALFEAAADADEWIDNYYFESIL